MNENGMTGAKNKMIRFWKYASLPLSFPLDCNFFISKGTKISLFRRGDKYLSINLMNVWIFLTSVILFCTSICTICKIMQRTVLNYIGQEQTNSIDYFA